ncbi:MAG: hypothetical protein WC719_01505 [Patescibacteria group bacterium]|jgi:hypothetical protein
MKENKFNERIVSKDRLIKEEKNLGGDIESLESDEMINGEILKESEKLGVNLEGLQKDVKEFGNEEELGKALEKNPGIAGRILGRAAKIAGALVMFNAVLVGSLAEETHHLNFAEMQSGDFKDLATTLFKIVAASGVISLAYEGIKRAVHKDFEKESDKIVLAMIKGREFREKKGDKKRKKEKKEK